MTTNIREVVLPEGYFDAFCRLRVSTPHPESEVSFQFDLNPLYVDVVTTGSASVTFDSSSRTGLLTVTGAGPTAGVGTVTVSGAPNPRTATFTSSQTFATGDVFEVGGTPYYIITGATGTVFSVNGTASAIAGSGFTVWGSHAVIRQKQRNLYQKGRSQLILMTFILPAAVEGTRVQVGYYALHNGYYLTRYRTGGNTFVAFVERTFTTGAFVENEVLQANWNIDPLDGTGPSGITLDLTKEQIWGMDAQFLGVGRVRIGFDIGGVFVLAHEFMHANVSTVAPYMQYFSLPCVYELFNIAASAGTTARAICFSVDSEGGSLRPPQVYNFTAYNTANVATSTARTHIISVRPKQTFNGVLNLLQLSPYDVSILAGAQAGLVEVIYGCTLTGGAWVSVGANSGMEYNLGATISVLGTVAIAFFVAGGAGAARASGEGALGATYPLVLDYFGANPTALTVAVSAITGTPDYRAAINWQEQR